MMRKDPRRGSRSMIGVTDSRGSRAQGIVIIVLLLLLIVSLMVGIPSIQYRREADNFLAARMLTECDSAVQRAQRLSRNASSTSAQTIAELRSNVYAMDILNQTRLALAGKAFLDTSSFSELYSQMESYANQLIQGTDTGALQTSISALLQTLYEQIQRLN